MPTGRTVLLVTWATPWPWKYRSHISSWWAVLKPTCILDHQSLPKIEISFAGRLFKHWWCTVCISHHLWTVQFLQHKWPTFILFCFSFAGEFKIKVLHNINIVIEMFTIIKTDISVFGRCWQVQLPNDILYFSGTPEVKPLCLSPEVYTTLKLGSHYPCLTF